MCLEFTAELFTSILIEQKCAVCYVLFVTWWSPQYFYVTLFSTSCAGVNAFVYKLNWPCFAALSTKTSWREHLCIT